MASGEAKRDWVLRVLGVALPDAARRPALAPVWNEAKEQMDASLTALCNAVREVEHPLTERLVDSGLSGFTGRVMAPLTAALLSYDAAATGAAGQAVLSRLQEVRAFLAGDRVIGLIEDNPFGVPVAVRAPLLGALARIEKALPA